MNELGPRIVIVGAGAMGVSIAQHLTLAGAEITFLVRPGRAANAPHSYRLYSYDDAELHELSGFGVIDNPAGIVDIDPAFVLMTLDGASLTSANGKTLLVGIGDAIRDTDAVLIIGSVGIGVRELAVEASRLPDERVVSGMIGLVVHKGGLDLPVHAPTAPGKLAQADYAFRHLNVGGFLLENHNEAAAGKFAALFDKSGAKCFVVPPEEFGVQSRGIMPVFVTAEILGWPEAEALFADPLWPVTVEAVRSIQALDEHGATARRSPRAPRAKASPVSGIISNRRRCRSIGRPSTRISMATRSSTPTVCCCGPVSNAARHRGTTCRR